MYKYMPTVLGIILWYWFLNCVKKRKWTGYHQLSSISGSSLWMKCDQCLWACCYNFTTVMTVTSKYNVKQALSPLIWLCRGIFSQQRENSEKKCRQSKSCTLNFKVYVRLHIWRSEMTWMNSIITFLNIQSELSALGKESPSPG